MKTRHLKSWVFEETDLRSKVEKLVIDLKSDLASATVFIPELPGRSASTVETFRGQKEKLSSPEGKARLLHELCNIELQAMELALRTWFEFPQAPPLFREELASIAIQESEHLLLCLNELESRGFRFGNWPVHLQLWRAVSAEDSLLDRLLIVHRYLEGSGLDSSSKILKKLKGVNDSKIEAIVQIIQNDEIKHVEFGSRWYRSLCSEFGLDPAIDFPQRLKKMAQQLPKRVDVIDEGLRFQAGFTQAEIQELKFLQMSWWQDVSTQPQLSVPPSNEFQ